VGHPSKSRLAVGEAVFQQGHFGWFTRVNLGPFWVGREVKGRGGRGRGFYPFRSIRVDLGRFGSIWVNSD